MDAAKYEYPIIMGEPITREEMIEGLREAYAGMLKLEKQTSPGLVSFPDMEQILNHIEEHGIPAKNI